MTLKELATLLETTDKKQCFGTMIKDDACCALGLVVYAIEGDFDEQTFVGKRAVNEINFKFYTLTGHTIVDANDKLLMDFKSMAKLIRSKLEARNDST